MVSTVELHHHYLMFVDYSFIPILLFPPFQKLQAMPGKQRSNQGLQRSLDKRLRPKKTKLDMEC